MMVAPALSGSDDVGTAGRCDRRADGSLLVSDDTAGAIDQISYKP
jgi:hypothetical protein